MVNDPHQPGNMFQMFHKPGEKPPDEYHRGHLSLCRCFSMAKRHVYLESMWMWCDWWYCSLECLRRPQFLQQFCSNCQFEKSCLICRDPIILPSREYIRPTGQSIMSRRFQGGACEFFPHTLDEVAGGPMGHGASDVVNNGKTTSNQHRDSECSSECVGPRAPIRTYPKRCLTARHGLRFSVSHSRPCFEACGDRWEVALLLFDEAKVLMQTAKKGQKGSMIRQCVYGCFTAFDTDVLTFTHIYPLVI